MLLQTESLQLALDLVGVFVFALSGGLMAVSSGLDLFGVLVLAAVAGLGGGVLRDLLIGVVPPVGVSDWRPLVVCLLAGLLTFRWHRQAARLSRPVRVLDAAGLAAFSVSGALMALSVGAGATTAVLVGGITAVGGGVLRDLLVGRIPEVLRRELYALPALAGAALIVIADRVGILGGLVVWGAALAVFVLRMVAVVFDLHVPTALRAREDR
ncbi:MAG: trimeric intracellular cation channel family protein [Nostocoides sp.]